MLFPVLIKYNRPLLGNIPPEKQSIVVQYIQTFITEKKADNVIISDTSVSYKGTTSKWRGALFGGVDEGVFKLMEIDSKACIVYDFTMRRLFITTAIMSVVAGFVVRIWWVSIFAFLWLCGMNWIINLIRHGDLISEIVIGVNDLLFEMEVKIEEKARSEELKSWF
jgi:hypothetical protein